MENAEASPAGQELKNRVDRCYSANSPAELKNVYDEWAALYESDLVNELGWDGPRQTADYLRKYCGPESRVLDVGAGTGLGGVYLKKHGFSSLDALDLSEEMLAEARKKKAYDQFLVMELGRPLAIADGAYDAIVATGVFTEAHAGPESLDELLRITRSGGHLVFSLRPDVHEDMGFKEKQDALEAAGSWKNVEVSPLLNGFREIQSRPYRVFIYQAC